MKEIVQCIDRSLKEFVYPVFKVNPEKAYSDTIKEHNSGGFVRIITKGEEVIGYGVAKVCQPMMHSDTRVLSQTVYHSSSKGIIALRAMILFHDAMEEYAIRCKIPAIMSSSNFDNYQTFNRILSKQGWESMGSMMVKSTR